MSIFSINLIKLKEILNIACDPRHPYNRVFPAWCIPTLIGWRASFLGVFLIFVRAYVLLRKTRQQQLPRDEIRFHLSRPCPDKAGGGLSLLDVTGFGWPFYLLEPLGFNIRSFVIVCLEVGAFQFNLHFSFLVTLPVLVCWSLGALAGRPFDCQLQQGFPDSDEGAMTVVRLCLASVIVVAVRWSTNLYEFLLLVFFVLALTVHD